jgi:hypothetical protein
MIVVSSQFPDPRLSTSAVPTAYSLRPALEISGGFLVFCTTYRSRQTSMRLGRAARGGGRDDSRGPGLCGSALPSEAPFFVHRRDAMISPQRHRDRRENSQLVAGDGRAPSPCPPPARGQALCASVVKICAKRTQFGASNVRNEANCPLEGVGRGRPTHEEPRGRLCKTNPISGSPSMPGGRIAQNKAKLGQDGISGGRHAREEAIVRNEANSSIADFGLQIQRRLRPAASDRCGPIVQNEPNSPPDRHARSWLEQIVRNEPNFRPAEGWGRPIVQNEPNFVG